MTILMIVLATAVLLLPTVSSAQETCEQSSACTAGLGHQTTPVNISGNQMIYKYDMDYFRAVVEDAAQRCRTIARRMEIVGAPSCGGPHRMYGCPRCPLVQDCVATFECK